MISKFFRSMLTKQKPTSETCSMGFESMSTDALQEYYAFKFYKIYHRFPTSKHYEPDRNKLISKIKILQSSARKSGQL